MSGPPLSGQERGGHLLEPFVCSITARSPILPAIRRRSPAGSCISGDSVSTIHVFDVDHTITRRSTGVRFLIEGVRMGIFPIRPLLSVPRFFLRYRLGRMTARHLRSEIPMLKGKSRAEMERIAQQSFERRIRHDVYSDAEKLIQDLVARGSEVVLASLSLDLVVRPLADRLGVREIVATSFEFEEGACTGRLADGPVFNEEKSDRVLRLLSARGIAPEDCYFYTDSVNDLPLLRRVGHPIAVNPDRRLAKEAARRGWKVLRFY